MKKGFTLIELLAVIVILAVVALIATPIVLDVINDAKDSTAKSQAYYILDGANKYYVESIFDNNKQNKIDNLGNIYDDIEMSGKKPQDGKLYVNDKGLTAMSVVINNKCYKKEFGGELQIIDSTDCDLGYVGNDEISPTIEFAVVSNPFNSNGWANQDFYVNINVIDNESGAYSYRWCSGINDCEPIALIEESNGNVLISTESDNSIVCAIGYDKAGNNSSKTCSESYKLDKQKPVLTAVSNNIEIAKDDDNLVSSYFNVSYSISGGSLSCSPINTNILTVGTQTVSCTATGENGLTTTSTKTITVQALEYVDNSGANAPILFTNMIPVVYDGVNWIRVLEKQSDWYSYDEKVWANAVVLNSGVTKSVGQTISESEIAMMYVWIPRYKYTIFNGNNGSVSPQQINVVFENGIAKTGTVTCTTATSGSGSSSETCSTITNGVSTYTHPAFTFGTQELKGIWVGKFENGTTDTDCNTNQHEESCNKVLPVIIKPNVRSWRNANVSNFHTSILNVKTDYGMNVDSHMMKNMEWGAVAYLTQSKYGRCNSGTCTEIAKNDSSDYYTGRSLGRPSSADEEYSPSGTYTYEVPLGQQASTTGNIYGVYDMSGGAWDYVMGNMVNSSNQFYGLFTEFSTNPPTKYYDAYTYDSPYDSPTNITHSRGRLGDATKETLQTYGSYTGGWYGDYADFPYSTGAWFARGGYYSNGAHAGVFRFYGNNGSALGSRAARVVVVSADDN